ncbi:RNA polymerase sigma factor [Stieleria varia]|uniref:RNA polymerase sigma factor n=1 Tax=Stieleria varia TaxID=2528005 RepID=A0A5C5ZWJ3_9BACT|nr:sigma-70 family RNA polymerase sigma factor [Stieleria varia]TWT91964.1 RNA polymerase sigma factor [Stieleria varia]
MELEITDDWLRRLAAGDPITAAEFFQRFGGPMQRVADRNMGARLRQRVDPEDIVQSACRTFFRRLEQGQFELDGEEDLWHLICAITLNKLRRQARYHSRLRRDVTRQEAITDTTVGITDHSPQDPVWTAQWNEVMAECFDGLSEEQRKVLQMRLEGYRQMEIAEAVGCAERTVRRILAGVRDQLLKQADFDS